MVFQKLLLLKLRKRRGDKNIDINFILHDLFFDLTFSLNYDIPFKYVLGQIIIC